MKLLNLCMDIRPFLIVYIIFISCQGSQPQNPDRNKNNDSILQIYKKDGFGDSLIRLQVKNVPHNCNDLQKSSNKSELEFLIEHIKYYDFNQVDHNKLKDVAYYKLILMSSDFLQFQSSDFIPGNFIFSHEFIYIPKYGRCALGKFYFPSAINSAQRRSTIIINLDRSELSIWAFDDLRITRLGIQCDFNVRGKHTKYNLHYSNSCRAFIED